MDINQMLMNEDEYLQEWGNPFKTLATAQAHSELAQRDHMIKVDESFVEDVGHNLANARLEKIDNVWYIVANKSGNVKQEIVDMNQGSGYPDVQ